MAAGELVMAVCMGVGLAAACGFRVFLPLFVASVAIQVGIPAENLPLSPAFAWVATPPSAAALGLATLLEIGGYYIPWLDNLLDTIATPAAILAGTLATAAFLGQLDPLVRWSTAIMAGGGAATATQLFTITTRAASTATTGGAGNPIVSTAEAGSSLLLTILALLLPLLTAALVLLAVIWIVRKLFLSRSGHQHTPPAPVG